MHLQRAAVTMERIGRHVTRKRKQLSEHVMEKQTAPTKEGSSSSSNGRPAKKRKQDGGNLGGSTACTVNKPPKHGKGKAMPKCELLRISECLLNIEVAVLVEEIWNLLANQFTGGNLGELDSAMCKSDQPLFEIAKHHHDNFVRLYMDCKKSFMQFQLRWHSHCSVFYSVRI